MLVRLLSLGKLLIKCLPVVVSIESLLDDLFSDLQSHRRLANHIVQDGEHLSRVCVIFAEVVER